MVSLCIRSQARSVRSNRRRALGFCAHGLFGKPLRTFPDHALESAWECGWSWKAGCPCRCQQGVWRSRCCRSCLRLVPAARFRRHELHRRSRRCRPALSQQLSRRDPRVHAHLSEQSCRGAGGRDGRAGSADRRRQDALRQLPALFGEGRRRQLSRGWRARGRLCRRPARPDHRESRRALRRRHICAIPGARENGHVRARAPPDHFPASGRSAFCTSATNKAGRSARFPGGTMPWEPKRLLLRCNSCEGPPQLALQGGNEIYPKRNQLRPTLFAKGRTETMGIFMRRLLIGAAVLSQLSRLRPQQPTCRRRSYTKAPAMTAPQAIYNWTGFYIGGHLGGAFAGGNSLEGANGRFLGGVQGGFDYQFAPNWVMGLEAQYSWLNRNTTGATFPGGVVVTGSNNQLGSVTGRHRLHLGTRPGLRQGRLRLARQQCDRGERCRRTGGLCHHGQQQGRLHRRRRARIHVRAELVGQGRVPVLQFRQYDFHRRPSGRSSEPGSKMTNTPSRLA